IFGKAEAGKSTLMSTLIPGSINIHHKGRTIAMDFGTINYNGHELHFYGTPGQARFECLRDIIALKADMAIMVFDGSTGIDQQDRAILDEVKALGVPFIGVLNHKPQGPRTSHDEVRALCSRYKGLVTVLEGSVKDRAFTRTLLEHIIKVS
ncbi:MAG: hypothetical protein D6778_07740, partial [Nitrospirae bacterium]